MTWRPTPTKTMRGPLFSITASGWLGRSVYGHRQYRAGRWVEPKWVVPNPYPIGGVGHIWIPYSLWDRQIFGMYHVPTWGLKPYPGFISQYYSPMGWTYEMRRTWHGMTPTPKRSTWAGIRHNPYQFVQRNRFYYAIKAWQGLGPATKDIYNKLKYPRKMSGYNRFISQYIKTTLPPAVVFDWADLYAGWSDSKVGWSGSL